MKSRLLLFLFCALLVSNVGLACNLVMCYEADLQGYTDITAYMPDKSCLIVELRCGTCNGQKIKVSHCIACDSNYEWYEKNEIVSGGLTVSYGSCRVKQNDCDDCDGKCKGEYWQRIKDGYEQKLKETCNQETCECYTMLAVEYRCESGYRQEGDKVSCTMNINGGDVECYGCKKCSAEDNNYGDQNNEPCRDTEWRYYKEGYEIMKEATFDENACSCEFDNKHRCAAGYYGKADLWSSVQGNGCKLCPEAENIFTDEALTKKARGTSVAGSNSDAKNCYLKNDTYYMKSGTVKITNSGDNTCQYVK